MLKIKKEVIESEAMVNPLDRKNTILKEVLVEKISKVKCQMS